MALAALLAMTSVVTLDEKSPQWPIVTLAEKSSSAWGATSFTALSIGLATARDQRPKRRMKEAIPESICP